MLNDHVSRTRFWLGGAIVLALALVYHFVGLATTPPGLDRDAAANGTMALQWLRAGIFPFWMPHASAPEPLIVWLQTLTSALMGPSVAALRSASALFMAAAAPVVYALAWVVAKPFPQPQRWWAALLTGLIFAVNPVVTQIARSGLRASTLPLLSALFFLLLLRAWHTHDRRDYVISGLVLGVAAYTYLAARFLPIVIVVFVLCALWAEEQGIARPKGTVARKNRARLVGLGLMVLSALVVVLPQLFFFVNYPMAFWERAQSVSLLSNPEFAERGLFALLAEKVWALLLMFGVQWSGQYNQAARPLLLPLPLLGLVLALPLVWRWRRLPAMILMTVTLVIMLLPDLIGGDRVQPHELRVIGAFVPTMVLSGTGLAFGLGWAQMGITRRIRGEWAWNVLGALLALAVAGWGIVDWFGVSAPRLAQSDYAWFARPDVTFAERINQESAPMLLPLNEYSRSIVAYLAADRIKGLQSGIKANGQIVQPSAAHVLMLWPAVEERERVESTSYRFDPNSLVLIDGDRAYLMPPARGDVAQLQQACDAQPFAATTGVAAGEICTVDYAGFEFPDQYTAPVWRVDDLFGEPDDEELRLRGISADRDMLTPGAELGITSFWQPTRRTDDRWRYFVHVLDDHQQLVAGDDLIPGYGIYGARLWQPDEIVPVRQLVQLPDELAPGRYWIEVGLYNPLSFDRAVVDGTMATRSLVGPLKVPWGEDSELPNAVPLTAHFGDEVALEGFTLVQNDAGLQVTLRLAALRQPEQDYTVFVHVENAAGEMVGQVDAQPHDALYPTAIWDTGEEVVASWQVNLSAPLAPGTHRVWMGLYSLPSGTRLPVQAQGATVDADRLLLDEIELR